MEHHPCDPLLLGVISLLSAGIAAGQIEQVNIQGISRQKGTLRKLYLGFP